MSKQADKEREKAISEASEEFRSAMAVFAPIEKDYKEAKRLVDAAKKHWEEANLADFDTTPLLDQEQPCEA